MKIIVVSFIVALGFAQVAIAQSAKAVVPDLTGVYEIVPNNVTLPGGFKNSGGPEDLSLQPETAAKAKATDLSQDPAKTCQFIGPFRMMAREGNVIDVLPSLSQNRLFILFEDYYLGFFREIFFDRRPEPKKELPPEDGGQGESFGYWEGGTLVVETINFNQWVWLNAKSTPHSDAFHLTERYRLVGGGRYLEVKATAEDPKVLTKPDTYTRYYQKVNKEVPQYECTDDLVQHTIPDIF